MMLEYNRNQAQLAAQHGQREAGRAYFDEARRIADDLPYAYLDQDCQFPSVPKSALHVARIA